MSKRISVFIKEPNKAAKKITFSQTYGNFQKAVGGKLEFIQLPKGYLAICNENAREEKQEHCCDVCGFEFVGNVVFAKVDKGNRVLDVGSYSEFKKTFQSLFYQKKKKA